MSWVTFLWAAIIGACITMALPYLLIAIRQRSRVNLMFVLAALSVAGIAFGELAMMHSKSAEQFGRAQQWSHVPVFFLVVAIAGFVHLYFRSGRLWLGIAACLVRLVSLIANFALPPNVNYRVITALRPSHFLGESIPLPEGVISPWTHVGELSSILLLAFVVDASIRLWRRGSSENRRRATIVGGSITLFIIIAAGLSALTHAHVIHLPYLISLPFVGVIAAMGFELSYDVLRAAQTARRLQISETALRESELRMSLAASAGKLGFWIWHVPDDDIWMTDKARKLFGFSKSEPINLDRFFQLVHTEDRARVTKLVQDSLAAEGEYEGEYRITRPDGTIIWLSGYGRVELDQRGKPAFMHGVTRDITKRKMAEEALRESEARFRTVADVAPVMIWMSGTDMKCIFFNRRWLEFTGRTIEQELGDGWAEGVHAEDIDNCLDTYRAAFSERKPFTMEYRLRRHDGEFRWILDTGTPRFDTTNVFLGYIGSCIDLTDRKQTELDYQLQNMELARVGRVALIGELAASLAHEVNNPIGAMVANANAAQRLIVKGQIEEPEFQAILADIVSDGYRAREVIQGIRNMVRKSETSHALIRMNEVIRDLLRIVRADALAREVTLVTDIDPHLGMVTGDRVQLLQVLLNLTINAFEALSVIRAGERRVTIRARRSDDASLSVTVHDSGPGFPKGLTDQLFESFFSTKAEGTGMGLAIARSIAASHGGTLLAENVEGGGACFTLRLPEAKDDQSEAA